MHINLYYNSVVIIKNQVAPKFSLRKMKWFGKIIFICRDVWERGWDLLLADSLRICFAGDQKEGSPGEVEVSAQFGLCHGKLFVRKHLRGRLQIITSLINI